jgi:hypothetical protein
MGSLGKGETSVGRILRGGTLAVCDGGHAVLSWRFEAVATVMVSAIGVALLVAAYFTAAAFLGNISPMRLI